MADYLNKVNFSSLARLDDRHGTGMGGMTRYLQGFRAVWGAGIMVD